MSFRISLNIGQALKTIRELAEILFTYTENCLTNLLVTSPIHCTRKQTGHFWGGVDQIRLAKVLHFSRMLDSTISGRYPLLLRTK